MHTHLQYTTIAGPRAVATGDLNKDGHLDMVTANWEGNTVSVFISNPDGTFPPAKNYEVGTNPSSIAIADIDGNGTLDIVTANSGADSVSALLRKNDGAFSVIHYSVGKYPWSIAIADIDGNGSLDIVTANTHGNTVSVLYRNSDGTFSPVSYDVGKRPYTVVIADINGDNKLDIVTANNGDSTLSVLVNDSDRTFSLAQNSPYPVGYPPYTVALADVDGDNNLDIVTTNYDKGLVSVFFRNPAEILSITKSFSYAVGQGPASIAIADLNKDSRLIAIANDQSSSISLLIGNSDGTLSMSTGSPYAVGKNPVAVALADMDGDSYLDVVVANYQGRTVSILSGKATYGQVSQPSGKFLDSQSSGKFLDSQSSGKPLDSQSSDELLKKLLNTLSSSQFLDKLLEEKLVKYKPVDASSGDDVPMDVDAPMDWWSNLQPYAIPTAFVAVGLSIVGLVLKRLEALNAQVANMGQSIQQLNARLDGGEMKVPEADLPYTAAETQDFPQPQLAGDGGIPGGPPDSISS
jgi:hypothetical protein